MDEDVGVYEEVGPGCAISPLLAFSGILTLQRGMTDLIRVPYFPFPVTPPTLPFNTSSGYPNSLNTCLNCPFAEPDPSASGSSLRFFPLPLDLDGEGEDMLHLRASQMMM